MAEQERGRGEGKGNGKGHGRRNRERAPRLRDKADPRLSHSLECGVAVLECFTHERRVLGVADISELLKLGRSTAHRYATTLYALGYLEQDRQRKYRLSGRACEPGIAVIGAARVATPVGSVLTELRQHTRHTVSMGVLDGARAVYVHRLHAHRRGQYAADLDLGVGASVPLHCSALGKALLASLADEQRRELVGTLELERAGPGAITSKRRLAVELNETRERGLALSDEELARGVRSLAVPILPIPPERARPIAIDVTVPASSWTMQRLERELGPLVREAAEEISTVNHKCVSRQRRRAR